MDHTAAPLRVLFVSRSFPPSIGGIERHNCDLLSGLRNFVDVHAIINRRGRSFLPLFYLIALFRSLIVASRVDVVLLGDGVLAPLGFVVRKLTGTPVCSVVHGLDLTYQNAFYQRVFVGALLRLDRILAVSQETKQRAVARGATPTRCRHIPNGVQIPFEATAAAAATDACHEYHDRPKTILTVGRLVERKGIAWFVQNVVPQLPPDARYVVAGDGPERAAIESAVRELDEPWRVEVRGPVTETEKWRLMREARVFVQPNIEISGDMEGFGIVVLEAAAMALPVVAADLEGLRDAIKHEENGLLIPTRDSAGFARILAKLIGDSDYAMTLGQRARKVVFEQFNWESIAGMYAVELREVVTGSAESDLNANSAMGEEGGRGR